MNVKMGVCSVTFDGVDLGHTKGGVKLTYRVESESVETDQSDAPVDVVITKQPCEVLTPLVDFQLEKLAQLIPNCTMVVDSVDSSKKRLEVTGEAGASLASRAKPLVIKPIKGDDNDIVTLYYAAPLPEFDLTYDKSTNMHIYSVRFKALRGENGYIAFGNPSATE